VSNVEQELITQPACWRQAVAEAPAHTVALPRAGERAAVVGCGTSLFMARSYAARREHLGHGETDAFPASEFPIGRGYDRVVAVSRSGTTTEVVDLVRRIGPSTPTTAITAAPATPLAALAEHDVVLAGAAEQSIVQTRFPTTALALLRAVLGESLNQAIADAEQAVAADLPIDVGAHHQFTFLGSGWAAGLADEAALKCREAAGAWTESYPAMEYRHGPISVSGPGTVVWMLGPAPAGLADAVAETGATWVESALDPMAELIRAQRAAVALAEGAGRDPDRPRALTFSVVLDPAD
jgi:fructoselysine-6-P-deglycase FrlB-like protein